MITAKKLKEEILTYDVIKYTDEEGKLFECVEVTLADRIIDIHMDTHEINVGIIVKKILEDNLYEE
ncbi:MAG: hypothetical protein RR618_02025 [Cellulosilyticaceae bacterium]